MKGSHGNLIPITEKDLAQHKDDAELRVSKVEWSPTVDKASMSAADKIYESMFSSAGALEEATLVDSVFELFDERRTLPDSVNHSIRMLMRGIQIGKHVANLYADGSNLTQLERSHKQDINFGTVIPDVLERRITAASVAVFNVAHYVLFALAKHRVSDLANIHMSIPTIPEIDTTTVESALDCMVFYYTRLLIDRDLVHNDLEFVRFTQVFFQAYADALIQRSKNLKHQEPYTSRSYQLEAEDYVIKGFELILSRTRVQVYRQVSYDEFVGTQLAISRSKREMIRLLCCNLKSGMNPWMKLGGMTGTRLITGKPGTGKSMLAAANYGYLVEMCGRIYGDRYQTQLIVFEALVTKWQGESKKAFISTYERLEDPRFFNYGVMDDAENDLRNRKDAEHSEGSTGVVGAFLTCLEGIRAVRIGNFLFDLLSNIPEIFDPAVIQRIAERIEAVGPKTWAEYYELDNLWMRGLSELHPNFVTLASTEELRKVSKKSRRSLFDIYRDFNEPSHNKVRELFDAAHKRADFKKDPNMFLAVYDELMGEMFPRYSPRDKRNISVAVMNRINDFDLPQEWIDKPKKFFLLKNVDDQVKMLAQLREESLKSLGFSLADVRLQETNRYFSQMLRMAEEHREKRISDMLDQYFLEKEAKERIVEIGDDKKKWKWSIF